MSEHIDVQKATAGQFRLIWMSCSELSLAMRILEDRDRGEGEDKENNEETYKTLKEAMEVARKWREQEEMQQQKSSW